MVASKDYRVDPVTGNTVTISLPSGTNLRHLKPNVTGDTGRPAAQLGEVEAYLS